VGDLRHQVERIGVCRFGREDCGGCLLRVADAALFKRLGGGQDPFVAYRPRLGQVLARLFEQRTGRRRVGGR
jgi:hypothetical protein